MKVAFFGASVTAQKEGYSHHLSKLLKTEHIQMGFGSQHLCDAGICKLDDVLVKKPELCFIDWFSTGFTNIDDKTKIYIDTLIHGFSAINCKLVFLFLPRIDHEKRKKFYDFVKEHLTSQDMIYIDLNDHIKFSDKICRDCIHTTPVGSKLYANIVHREYKKISKKLRLKKDTVPTEYTNIKVIHLDKRIYKHLNLVGICKIVTVGLLMGKGNGIVDVGGKKIQTWDRWCYYERYNCRINDIVVDGDLQITILNDEFDHSECTDKSVNFNKEKKYLHVKDIYYVGDKLQIKNYQ